MFRFVSSIFSWLRRSSVSVSQGTDNSTEKSEIDTETKENSEKAKEEKEEATDKDKEEEKEISNEKCNNTVENAKKSVVAP